MNLLSIVSDLFKPAVELVDKLHTSEDEKLTAKAVLLNTQAAFMNKALEFENERLQARAGLVEAEIKSESFITRNWRPMTMLAFVAAVLAYWFGLTPDSLPEEAVTSMFELVKLGLGGYVVGRSVEKVAPGILKAFKKKEQT